MDWTHFLDADAIAVDIETSVVNDGDSATPWRGDWILGASLSNGRESVYLPVGHAEGNLPVDEVKAVLADVFDNARLILMHNALFDTPFLVYYGYWPSLPPRCWDTMVAAWLINENDSKKLKDLTGEKDAQDELKRCLKPHCRDCGHDKQKALLKAEVIASGREWVKGSSRIPACKQCRSTEWQPKRSWQHLTVAEMDAYAVADARMTCDLYKRQMSVLAQDEVEIAAMRREMRLVRVVYDMKMLGVPVDGALAAREHAVQQERRDALAAQFDFNLGSTPQLRAALLDAGVKLTHETKSGALSTDKDALLPHISHPLVKRVFEYRDAEKQTQFFSSLLNHRDVEGRVHPGWKPHGTVSGRFSCADPNLQQLPRKGEVRHCLRAPEGYTLLTGDLSQAEVRVFAAYASCASLIRQFEAGEDVYQGVADELGIDRQTAKIVVLSHQYLAGPRKLRLILLRGGVDATEKQCREFINGLKRIHPELRQFSNRATQVAERRGFVRLIQPGRYRRFPVGHWKANPMTAANALVQGGVGEAMKSWMLDCVEPAEALGVQIALQVHDSLGFFCPPDVVDGWKTTAEALWENANPFAIKIPVDWKEGM